MIGGGTHRAGGFALALMFVLGAPLGNPA